MKIAIIGYGKQGQSAYNYWRQAGHHLTICDSDEHISVPTDADSHLGKHYLDGLDQFDLIVRSPIIHPRDLVAAAGPEILNKLTTVTNEFFKVCPTKHILGVTGTKGKGTTSTLITKMLEASGKRVHLGGNIGTPPLDLLTDNIGPEDWVVLELANFQLIDLKYSPPLAVCLMIDPEHLDWHLSHDEYVEAKSQLFRHQRPEDTAIYYADNADSHRVATTSPGQQIPYMAEPGAVVAGDEIKIAGQMICKTSQLKLLGQHNWQNVCAAVTAVWQVTQDVEVMRSVLTTFAGLPFRMELRREVNGIRYYNDSFASSPLAPLAAIEAIPGRKVMILGGYDRQLELEDLAKGLAKAGDQLRTALLVGASAQRLADILAKHDFKNFTLSKATTMSAIVHEATGLARSGDAVVLSPGFASFDMFKNFEDRGKQFNEAVAKL